MRIAARKIQIMRPEGAHSPRARRSARRGADTGAARQGSAGQRAAQDHAEARAGAQQPGRATPRPDCDKGGASRRAHTTDECDRSEHSAGASPPDRGGGTQRPPPDACGGHSRSDAPPSGGGASEGCTCEAVRSSARMHSVRRGCVRAGAGLAAIEQRALRPPQPAAAPMGASGRQGGGVPDRRGFLLCVLTKCLCL